MVYSLVLSDQVFILKALKFGYYLWDRALLAYCAKMHANWPIKLSVTIYITYIMITLLIDRSIPKIYHISQFCLNFVC